MAVSEEAIAAEEKRVKSLEDRLCAAVQNGNYYLAKELIRQGADVNKRDFYGCLPLYDAVCLGNNPDKIEVPKQIANLLLDSGADVTLSNYKEITILDLFKMADRSYLNSVFNAHGIEVPEYHKIREINVNDAHKDMEFNFYTNQQINNLVGSIPVQPKSDVDKIPGTGVTQEVNVCEHHGFRIVLSYDGSSIIFKFNAPNC